MMDDADREFEAAETHVRSYMKIVSRLKIDLGNATAELDNAHAVDEIKTKEINRLHRELETANNTVANLANDLSAARALPRYADGSRAISGCRADRPAPSARRTAGAPDAAKTRDHRMNMDDGLKIEHAAGIIARDAVAQHFAKFAIALRASRLAGQQTSAAYIDGLAGVLALIIAGGHGSKDDVVNATVTKLREAVDRDLQHLGNNYAKH